LCGFFISGLMLSKAGLFFSFRVPLGADAIRRIFFFLNQPVPIRAGTI
jgi:hypothetical protein